MKKTFIVSFFCLIHVAVFGQNPSPKEEVSIYEVGKPIRSYESNFENLFSNWSSEIVSNADEFELVDYSFVEKIDDSQTYQHYRNYYSGVKAVGVGMSGSTSYHSNEDKRVYKIKLKPHNYYLDSSGYPNSIKRFITPEFFKEMVQLMEREINIDEMALNHYLVSKRTIESDSTYKTLPDGSKEIRDYSNKTEFSNFEYVTPHELSTDFININYKKTKTLNDLSPEEARKLTLEGLLVDRINKQRQFTKMIGLGDVVYKINFKYKGEPYTHYVICDAEGKKVIYDNVFLRIKLPGEG
ncbi:hypothetical protein [Echinicola sediminis]